MSKKIASILMSMLFCISLAGCDINIGKSKKEEQQAAEQQKTEQAAKKKEDSLLKGEFAEDRTIDDLRELFDEKAKNVEDVTKNLGLKYTFNENIYKVDGKQVTDKAIYFDNEDPDDFKMESMYFGMKLYGDKLASGDIALKLSLKFNGKKALKDGKFDLGETSFVKYIEAFTGEKDKDYSEINKTILDGLKNGQKEVIVSRTTNQGLKEEYLADNDYIVYKLSTKKFVFADAEMSME